jgi:dCMP deaminase
MSRPNWDQTWMRIADAIAERSKCEGRGIGAAIVSPDNAYVVVGYNGPPGAFMAANVGTCSAWCPRRQTGEQTANYANCTSVHAEANALIKADRSRIEGATLYVTSACCWDCGKMVSNSGIARVVMRLSEDDSHRLPQKTINFMTNCGLKVDIARDY